MTLMQFVVVIMRYVFSYGSIQMQESIWYMHGLLFMLGAGYTLVKEGHVRLDVFYREASERTKAWINLIGSLVFLLPFCIVNFDYAWSLVLNSWAVREGSIETTGLPYIYLFKTVILVFSILVVMEGLALAIRSLLTLTERSQSGKTAEA
ncbi:MAG: TRAP transporter small permease subunit [Gammaproteobacteria bacterium]|nr:TRAP transporter small permease subunit [Gammaproteobacteria bacterium]